MPDPLSGVDIMSQPVVPKIVDVRDLDPATKAEAIRAALKVTSDAVQEICPVTPNVGAQAQLFWLLRMGLIFGGGWLLQKGIDVSAWTGNDLWMIAGLALAAGGLIWSRLKVGWDKLHLFESTKAAAAASATATAASGVPTAVVAQAPSPKT